MLAGMFRDAVAELVADTLEGVLGALGKPAHPALPPKPISVPSVLVVGDVALGRSLAAIAKRRSASLPPIHVVAPAGHRAARKLEHVVVADDPRCPSLGEATTSVVIGVDAGASQAPDELLAAWRRLLVPGGGLILVDHCAPSAAARQALCAGLVELEQRHSGRAVVTCGLAGSAT